jgi:hypothetical protein
VRGQRFSDAEQCADTRVDEKYANNEAARPGGRSKVWEWTERLNCHRAGKLHEDRRHRDLSPLKRRPNRSHVSVKVGCHAHIWLRKYNGDDRVQVEYTWEHNNHSVGTLADIRSSMMPIRLRAWIKDLVEQGLDWPQIKMRLRVGEETLLRLGDTSSSITEIPETLRVAQKDVYNLIRERLRSLAILDPKDGHKSLLKWKEKLEKKGYRVYYKPVSCQAAGEDHYVFGFVSPWQAEVRGCGAEAKSTD